MLKLSIDYACHQLALKKLRAMELRQVVFLMRCEKNEFCNKRVRYSWRISLKRFFSGWVVAIATIPTYEFIPFAYFLDIG